MSHAGTGFKSRSTAVSSIQVQWFLNKALEEDADIIATFAAISKVLQEATRQYCEEDGDRVHGHFEFDLGFLDPIKIPDENPMDESGSDATTERLG